MDVVGATTKESMPVFGVMKFLINEGYTCIPVNPRIAQEGGQILGQNAVASLSDIKEKIDIVDIFMRSDRVAAVVDEAIQIQAGCVWTQIGVQDDVAAKKAMDAGLMVVQNRCPAIDIPTMSITTPRARLQIPMAASVQVSGAVVSHVGQPSPLTAEQVKMRAFTRPYIVEALRQRGQTVSSSDKVGGDTGLKSRLLALLAPGAAAV